MCRRWCLESHLSVSAQCPLLAARLRLQQEQGQLLFPKEVLPPCCMCVCAAGCRGSMASLDQDVRRAIPGRWIGGMGDDGRGMRRWSCWSKYDSSLGTSSQELLCRRRDLVRGSPRILPYLVPTRDSSIPPTSQETHIQQRVSVDGSTEKLVSQSDCDQVSKQHHLLVG